MKRTKADAAMPPIHKGPAPDDLLGLCWIDGVASPDGGRPALGDGVSVATIVWRQAAAPVDSGLPDALSLILSRALLTQGTVAFVDRCLGAADGRRRWRTTPGGLLCSLPLGYFRWRLWRSAPALDVMATDNEVILATLGFCEGGWEYQQQVMLVVPDRTAIDRLDGDVVVGWLGATPRPDFAKTFASGVTLAAAAGHDGDWCVVHASPADMLAGLRAALHRICVEAGLEWAEGEGPEGFRFSGYGPWPEADKE